MICLHDILWIPRSKILRNKKRMTVSVPLWIPQLLIPRALISKNVINATQKECMGLHGTTTVGGVPSYLMNGGLVFVSLCREVSDEESNEISMH